MINLILAIIWTIALIINIVVCIAGGEPTWWSYFCALGVLVCTLWERYLDKPDE